MAKTHNASQNQSDAPGDSIILEEEMIQIMSQRKMKLLNMQSG